MASLKFTIGSLKKQKTHYWTEGVMNIRPCYQRKNADPKFEIASSHFTFVYVDPLLRGLGAYSLADQTWFNMDG